MQIRFCSNPVITSLVLAGVLLLLSGCGNISKLTKVSGVVKAKGVPLTEGDLMFYPVAGGRPSMGMIGPDGRYELTSKKHGDGVAPGSYKVTITATKEVGRKNGAAPTSVEEEAEFLGARTKTVWLFPQKFSEFSTTTLTAEVEAGKPNEINFDSADFE